MPSQRSLYIRQMHTLEIDNTVDMLHVKNVHCMQWECVNSAFTPGSFDSTVDLGFFHLGLVLIST